jgi:outer membrane protein insertion porin family
MIRKAILTLLFLCAFLIPLIAQEGYRLQGIKFQGNQHISDFTLRNKLSIRQNSIWQKMLFWKQPYRLHQSELEIDIKQLIAHYQREGFLKVSITPQFLIDHDKETVSVRLIIEENQPVLVSALETIFPSADSTLAELEQSLAQILSKSSIRSGKRFRDVNLQKTEENLIRHLHKQGYPFAELSSEISLNDKETEAEITFFVEPKGKIRYGQIEVSGNVYIDSDRIMDQLTFQKGDYFNPADFEKTQKKIQQLGMFQFTNIQMTESHDNTTDVMILVGEAPRFSAQVAFGYALEDRLRTELKLVKLGFLGGIRRATLKLRYSYLEPYNLAVQFDQPAAFHPQATFSLNPFIQKQNEPGFDKRRIGIYSGYRYDFARFSRIYLDYDYESIELTAKSDFIEDELLEKGIIEYQLSSFGLGYIFENSFPVLFPEKGWFFSASTVLSGLAFYSDYNYFQILTEARKYTRINSKFILAARLKYYVMQAIEPDVVTPISERFYAGGKGSVRGWNRNELGPLNEEGVPIGGNSLLEASIEMRYPIYKILSGAFFCDAGNIWRKSFDHDLFEMEYAVGGGIRIKTPLGALRADVAFPVSEKEHSPRFYFSIGESF